MIIRNVTEDDLDKVSEFIAQYNSKESHFIAGMGISLDEIKEQLISLRDIPMNQGCALALKDNEIAGFLGVDGSKDQRVTTLLGPYIKEEHWSECALELWAKALGSIPRDYDKIKTAFYNSNTKCGSFCKEQKFNLYNIEKNLRFPIWKYSSKADQGIYDNILSYTEGLYGKLDNIHPQNAYFTTREMVDRINNDNRVLLYIKDEIPVGYIYYEMLTQTRSCEICFVNILEEYRGQGIGSILIKEVLRIAFQENEIFEVFISVKKDNSKAERLYKKLGFEEKSTIHAYEKFLL